MDFIRRDAAEVRGMLAASEWRKALLIARSVRPGASQGGRADLAPNGEKSWVMGNNPVTAARLSGRVHFRGTCPTERVRCAAGLPGGTTHQASSPHPSPLGRNPVAYGPPVDRGAYPSGRPRRAHP